MLGGGLATMVVNYVDGVEAICKDIWMGIVVFDGVERCVDGCLFCA